MLKKLSILMATLVGITLQGMAMQNEDSCKKLDANIDHNGEVLEKIEEKAQKGGIKPLKDLLDKVEEVVQSLDNAKKPRSFQCKIWNNSVLQEVEKAQKELKEFPEFHWSE